MGTLMVVQVPQVTLTGISAAHQPRGNLRSSPPACYLSSYPRLGGRSAGKRQTPSGPKKRQKARWSNPIVSRTWSLCQLLSVPMGYPK